MDPTTLLTSVSLAMDCFSVSISNSACYKRFRFQEALTSATSFGSFQFLMLCIGWLLGASVMSYIEALDHWVAFALLLLVGVRMIGGEGDRLRMETMTMLLMLSVATSIDALSVGIAISLIGSDMLTPAIIAGLSSFAMTLAGYQLGLRLGRMLGERAEKAGGLMLIAIGVKVLIDHAINPAAPGA